MKLPAEALAPLKSWLAEHAAEASPWQRELVPTLRRWKNAYLRTLRQWQRDRREERDAAKRQGYKARRGKRPSEHADADEYGALLLAPLFERWTGARPKQTRGFYQFADLWCDAANVARLSPRSALRPAAEAYRAGTEDVRFDLLEAVILGLSLNRVSYWAMKRAENTAERLHVRAGMNYNAVMQAKLEQHSERKELGASPVFGSSVRRREWAQKKAELDARFDKRVQELHAQYQAELEEQERREAERVAAEKLATLDPAAVEFERKREAEAATELKAELGPDALRALFNNGAPFVTDDGSEPTG